MTGTSSIARAILEIPLAKIQLHPRNPRRDPGDIRDLVASIEAQGVLEPILVVQHNGGYLAVAGGRRLAAAAKAGLAAIPAVVQEMTEVQAAAAALVENLQRKDLEPLEEAEGYKAYLDLTGDTQKALAIAVGKDPSTISNALRLLEAPPVIRAALKAGTITPAHARIALSVPAELVSSLEFADATTDELEQQAGELKRASKDIEQLRKTIAAKKAEGFDVTWDTGPVWVGRARLDLEKVLGKPPKRIAGPIGYVQFQGPPYGVQGSTAGHDALCDCRAAAIRASGGAAKVERVCVSPSGYKKYRASLLKGSRSKSGAVKKRVLSAAAKQKAKAKAEAAALTEATKALAGKLMGYRAAQLTSDVRYRKGGLEGEAGRLVLFGMVSADSTAQTKGWRLKVWEEITKLPLKDVRERTLAWGVGRALREIRDETKVRRELQGAVNDHYKAGRTR